MKNKLLIFAILFFYVQIGMGQIRPPFSYQLKELGITFTSPKGYTLDTAIIQCNLHNVLGFIDLNRTFFCNKKGVMIGISFVPLSKKMENEIRQASNNNISINEIYKNDIKGLADTSIHKVEYYDPKYVQKTYNSDEAGFYYACNPTALYYEGETVNWHEGWKEKYTHCAVVFIHKDYRGDITLYYFYNDTSAKYLKEEILKTREMVRFNDK